MLGRQQQPKVANQQPKVANQQPKVTTSDASFTLKPSENDAPATHNPSRKVSLFLRIIPFIFPVLAISTFIISYAISVQLKHVDAFWPLISDTGATVPESCIFAQLLNIGIIFLCATVYLRYMQIKEEIKSDGGPYLRRLHSCNYAAGIAGILTCLGISMVANFQKTNISKAHAAGALMYMVCGAVYFCIQTYFSHKWLKILTTTCLYIFRIVLSVFIVGLAIIVPILATVGRSHFRGDTKDSLKWTPDEGGWDLHLVSAISEWVMMILHGMYLASFSSDFRHIDFYYPFVQPMKHQP